MNITFCKGDITTIKTDAIVNCTTTKLVIGGGSLDTAIHLAAGPALMTECRRLIENTCFAIGECVVTGAHKLPSKKIVHTACPVYLGGGWREADHLIACYRSALIAADKEQCQSIAFPNIGTGAHTYPKQAAAEIAVATVREVLPTLSTLKRVVFVCFEEENYAIYAALLGQEAKREAKEAGNA